MMRIAEITEKVDALWAIRLTAIRNSNGELQPLVYEAWKLFEGKVGRPEAGADTFSAWLMERKIPHSTGYRILSRERARLGEVIIPVGQLPATDDDAEFDEIEPQDSPVDSQEGTVEASVKTGDAPASPSVKPVVVDPGPSHKPGKVDIKITAEDRTKRKNTLIEEMKAVETEAVVQALIDDAIIAALEKRLARYPSKKIDSKTRKAIAKTYADETAAIDSWEEV